MSVESPPLLPTATGTRVCLAALEMGYGHLRAAHALAAEGRLEVIEADRAPVAAPAETALWRRARAGYEWLSRATDLPVAGGLARRLLDGVTRVPPVDGRGDLSAPDSAVRSLRRFAARGLGAGLVEHLRNSGDRLISTFYSPAVIAADAGVPGVELVVTDSHVHRVWVPAHPLDSAIVYHVPARQTVERLRAYGVPASHIRFTGFPLPPALVGGDDLGVARANLSRRLARLDPTGEFRRAHARELSRCGIEPVLAFHAGRRRARTHVVFAVGGAGAQTRLARDAVIAFRGAIRRGDAQLTLVAGTRTRIAATLRRAIGAAGLDDRFGSGIDVLAAPAFETYLDAFHRLLADADVLWTKPSEMTFYGGLGLPLLLAPPLGHHERLNREWALSLGVARDACAAD
jgi:hypothetical protein